MDYTGQLVETCRNEIVMDFDAWYKQQYGAHLTPFLPRARPLVSELTAISAGVEAAEGGPEEEEEEQPSRRQTSQSNQRPAARAGISPPPARPAGVAKSKSGVSTPTKASNKSRPESFSIPEDEANDPEARAFWDARRALHEKIQAGEMGKFARKKEKNTFGSEHAGKGYNLEDLRIL